MLIDINTMPGWVLQKARLPRCLFGPKDDCEGADFTYCIRTAMLEDIEWQEELNLDVDIALLIERKWYRIWFKRDGHGYFNSAIPDTFLERVILQTRLKCIYRKLFKNGDLRKEYVRILVRALEEA